MIHRQSLEVLAAVGAAVPERGLDGAPLAARQIVDGGGGLPRTSPLLRQIPEVAVVPGVCGLSAGVAFAVPLPIAPILQPFLLATVLGCRAPRTRRSRVDAAALLEARPGAVLLLAPPELGGARRVRLAAHRTGPVHDLPLLGITARAGDSLTGFGAGRRPCRARLVGLNPEIGAADRAGPRLAAQEGACPEGDPACLRAGRAVALAKLPGDGRELLATDSARVRDSEAGDLTEIRFHVRIIRDLQNMERLLA